MSSEPIVIWGAGAIGGTIGAHLARGGHNVVFVDADAAHVERMAHEGLTIEGPLSNFTVTVKALMPEQVEGQFKLILLAVKAMHTRAAAHALAPHVAPDGAVASFQNGLNEYVIADAVGMPRTIGAFLNLGADWLAPGRIMYGGRGALVVGEMDGRRTPRIEALYQMMLEFEPDAILTDNIVGYLWGKLAYGTVLTASSLTNDIVGVFLASPEMRPLLIALISEVLAVARAEGVRPMGFQTFDADAFVRQDARAMNASLDASAESRRHSAKVHTGIWRDLAVRKRKTEIPEHYGPIQRAARRHRISTPTLDGLVAMITDIEDGRRTIGDALPRELRAQALGPSPTPHVIPAYS